MSFKIAAQKFLRPNLIARAPQPQFRLPANSTFQQLSKSRVYSTQTPQSTHKMIGNPLNLPKWLEENSHLLKPPINNYCVYNEDVTVMIVGGPNARSDYHINETAEWFYQFKGSMLLKIVDAPSNPSAPSEGVTEAKFFRDVPIREGEMFLLPPNTPHNPIRFANTVGIVLEQHRPDASFDVLRWYCQECRAVVCEKSFHCTDLGTQIKEAVNAFKADEEARKCKNCGAMCDTTPRGVVQP